MPNKIKKEPYLNVKKFFTISDKILENDKIKCVSDYNILFLSYNMFRFLSYKKINKSNMLSAYQKILKTEDVRQINYKDFIINKNARLKDEFNSFSEETWYYIDKDKNVDLHALYCNIYFHKVLNNMYSHKGFVQFNKTYEDFVKSIKIILETYKTSGNSQHISKNNVLGVINELSEILFLVLKEQDVFNKVFFEYDKDKLNGFIPSYLSNDSVETIYIDVLNINMILDNCNKDFVFNCNLLMDIEHKNLEHKVSSNSDLKFYIIMFRSSDKIKINLFVTCRISDFYTECVILNKSGKSVKIEKERYVNSQLILHHFATVNIKNNSKIKEHINKIDEILLNIQNHKVLIV